MDENVYKQIMLTGTSNVSMEEAVKNAVARAAKTVRHMRWFEVIETRGTIEEGAVEQWQVTVRIGFTLEGDVDVGA
jgi:flavin-binding protein dodecin